LAWKTIWESGYRMYGIGGSDSHMAPEERYPGSDLPSIYGDPTVYTGSRARASGPALAGIRKDA